MSTGPDRTAELADLFVELTGEQAVLERQRDDRRHDWTDPGHVTADVRRAVRETGLSETIDDPDR